MKKDGLLGLILASHAAMLAFLMLTQSPNIDEVAHVACGTVIWDYGVFEFYCVNPPLVRAIASLPSALAQKDASWIREPAVPELRPEFAYGSLFAESNPDNWFQLLVCGRLMLIPLSVAGGWYCFRWSADLFGRRAGFITLLLWCFSPNVLSWSSVVGTDGAATSLGVIAGYYFWQWLRSANWQGAITAGLLLGVTELSKMTWIILFVVWPAMWICSKVLCPNKDRSFSQLLVILLLGLSVLNMGYLYEGSFSCGADYEFKSRLLTSVCDADSFPGNMIRRVPIPFPYDYVRGVDLQRLDFENGRPSFLLGEWRDSGWWYYYIVAAIVKVPCGTLLLFLLATVLKRSAPIEYSSRMRYRDLLALIAPGLSVFILVSSQDGFSSHFRYALPALPYCFIWCSRSSLLFAAKRKVWTSLAVGLLAWSCLSSAFVYPHSLSYFNEIAGGPSNGHRWVNGTTLSWSQDRLRLRQWLDEHPEVGTPHIAVEWSVPLRLLGIISNGLPPDTKQGPAPGWHVLSKKILYGCKQRFDYFKHCCPVATIGYSIQVYYLSEASVRRLRHDLELEPRDMLDRGSLVDDLRTSQLVERVIRVALLIVDEKRPTSDESSMLKLLHLSPSVDARVVTPEDIRCGGLGAFDAIVVPGGQSRTQAGSLEKSGRESIRQFVRDGGGYVGICAGARLAASGDKWALALVNAQPTNGRRYVVGSGLVNTANRGTGLVSIRLTEKGRAVFRNSPDSLSVLFSGGPVFASATRFELPEYVTLANYSGEIRRFSFQERSMVNRPAIIAARFESGRVLLFGPHPEASQGAERMVVDALRSCAVTSEP